MQLKRSKLLNNFANVKHAFTTKNGGVSKDTYTSLNLAFHVNDNPWHVDINHNTLANELGFEKNSLVHMKQIHSDIVHIVADADNFKTPPTCDALITDKTNTPLMVMVADCSPVLFYDDEKKVIAVAHAGRAGAFKNIVKNVVNSFIKNFGSDAKNIYVSIGASIGECCYEVGSEIYDEACEKDLEYAMSERDNSYYLNVGKILESQLLACGIKKEHIEISNECSCCKNDTYFSYRADGVTGRFAGVIELN